MKPMNANELLAGLALARPVPITAVVTDSRKVQPGCIFVCFPGERVDGHDYAAKAYKPRMFEKEDYELCLRTAV